MGSKDMNKGKLNLTLDYDLIDYVKLYAQENRTTASEIICQFILNLKRKKERKPIDIIISDPDFSESVLDSISKIRNGKMKWHSYDEVF